MSKVSYEQARLDIQDGDIIFIKNNKGLFLPQLIRFFTRSPYTHVGIAFWITTGSADRLMVVEAQGGAKRRIVNLSYYEDDHIDVVEAPKDWDRVSEKAIERLNQVPYGWLQALYVGVREFLLQYFNVKLPMRDLPGEICSEFVARIYDLPERHISPQLLLDQLQRLGFHIR